MGTSPLAGSYGPVQFHTAYNLPCSPGGAVGALCSKPFSFGPQTIAIVDAYIDPNIESDLSVYDSQFGLPACTTANGCLQISNLCVPYKTKGKTYCGSTDSGWVVEESLDVEVAHAICQTCKIMLVEANSNADTDLGKAENYAASHGATVISNSWGEAEFSTQTAEDALWNHPNIAVLFAAGDSGYGASYPATSPYVLSVGGTTLTLNADSTYAGETVWNSSATNSGATGSGCSAYEPAPSWQTSLPNWSATGCGSLRASTDLSADGDPNTGAAVYDSTPYWAFGGAGWSQVGGTSLATPIVAAEIALAGGATGYQNSAQLPYQRMSAVTSHDVTLGSNGTCSTIMCAGGPGYDGPTGLGTPNGVAGL